MLDVSIFPPEDVSLTLLRLNRVVTKYYLFATFILWIGYVRFTVADANRY